MLHYNCNEEKSMLRSKGEAETLWKTPLKSSWQIDDGVQAQGFPGSMENYAFSECSNWKLYLTTTKRPKKTNCNQQLFECDWHQQYKVLYKQSFISRKIGNLPYLHISINCSFQEIRPVNGWRENPVKAWKRKIDFPGKYCFLKLGPTFC